MEILLHNARISRHVMRHIQKHHACYSLLQLSVPSLKVHLISIQDRMLDKGQLSNMKAAHEDHLCITSKGDISTSKESHFPKTHTNIQEGVVNAFLV